MIALAKFNMKLTSLIICLCLSAQLLAETAPNRLTESEKRSGWQLIFDGQTTDGWRNYNKSGVSDGWKIIDGALVRSDAGAGDLITDQKYGSFELALEYKISKGGNSGVMFHVVEQDGPPWYSGPEIQVQDNVDGHDPQLSGWLYQLYKPRMDATRPAGQWNQLYIRINNDDCEVCMNGVRYYRFKLGDENWNKRVAASKFAKLEGFGAAGEGHICLQDHGNEVAYRNIKVREFDEDGRVPQPIDGSLGLSSTLAFPDLRWEDWEPVDDDGQVRPLRLVELTYADDDRNRLFAISQNGGIWAFDNKPDVSEAKLFLDLRGKVKDWQRPGANEEGLLGLAMHPDFKNNGHFYVYYTHPTDRKTLLSRFTVSSDDSNRADPKSEQILLEIAQPYPNHNGGSIAFGPDGYLYVGLGDGGFANDPHGNGQNLGTLLGSILRLDVDHPSDGKNYGIPADNPFIETNGALPEIYAYGIRNAWRLGFDVKTGKLWCSDVGQDLWEEIIIVEKGGNYGWNQREGFHPFGNADPTPYTNEMIEPVWEYDHQIGKSITGGRVYRSDRLPQLAGKYLYADYVTGGVWALSFDESTGRVTRNEQVLSESVPVLAFGQDPSGEVYYMTSSARGECIYRFEAN